MNIQEFFNAGYKIKRKSNIETETIISVGVDEETGKVKKLKQIRPYEVIEDNMHNWFIIENKDGRIVELFEKKTAGTNKSLEQVEKDIIKYIENMSSPKKEWELDREDWKDLFFRSKIELTDNDVLQLNKHAKKFYMENKEDTIEKLEDMVRGFDSIFEYTDWYYDSLDSAYSVILSMARRYHNDKTSTVTIKDMLSLDDVVELENGGIVYFFE